jgi:hypothetical protein
MGKENILCFDYPSTLRDNEGYPTQEALDYIKNWTYGYDSGGQYFGKNKQNELIEYIKSIWTYNDAIVYEDGLLEIHTYGWSGNEDIIEVLKETDLWLINFRAEQAIGHYYFKMDDGKYDWQINKIKR